MFATIILGIGFIMVASIFPVALQQAKTTSDDAAAATIARSAANYVGKVASDGPTPTSTSNVIPLYDPRALPLQPVSWVVQVQTVPVGTNLWDLIRGNLIPSEDPRYASIILFRRDVSRDSLGNISWSPFIQLFVVAVQSRSTPIFKNADAMLPVPGGWTPDQPTANLMARPVLVAVANDVLGAGGADLIGFNTDPGTTPIMLVKNVDAAAEGAYVVIANDRIANPQVNTGRMNGRILKLGARRSEFDGDTTVFPSLPNGSTVYELQSGGDFSPEPGGNGVLGPPGARQSDDICALGIDNAEGSGVSFEAGHRFADAFLIGRGYSTETLDQIAAGTPNPPISYEGQSMPVGAFTTFVKVK